MVQAIMRDEAFLAQRAGPEDLPAARDLLDTLAAHRDGCVGMAANMIGVSKRIIVFDNEGKYMVIFNPEIIKKSGLYEAEEVCLSLTGTRKTRRWHSIKVRYQNEQFQTRFKTFTGWTAQIIQHKIGHCEGVLIGYGLRRLYHPSDGKGRQGRLCIHAADRRGEPGLRRLVSLF